MVDDCSKDNSVNLIKDLMKKDPRILLHYILKPEEFYIQGENI